MLLFTEDCDVAKTAFGSWEQDSVDMQAEISLQGFGLSVVDNVAAKEVCNHGILLIRSRIGVEISKGMFYKCFRLTRF